MKNDPLDWWVWLVGGAVVDHENMTLYYVTFHCVRSTVVHVGVEEVDSVPPLKTSSNICLHTALIHIMCFYLPVIH